MVEQTSRFVLDTNIVLYYLGGRLAEPLPSGQYFVSVITEMELLSYPNLREVEERYIREFLDRLQIINLNDTVKNAAIALRQQHRFKLPDAIVVLLKRVCQSRRDRVHFTTNSQLTVPNDLFGEAIGFSGPLFDIVCRVRHFFTMSFDSLESGEIGFYLVNFC